ncbi:50S ribosomal protein L21 [Gangjinia marincola]|uniref:Large ribosomal subunit protein bL21 n=1 Tax=Gangjinia marincola TaxID=578463 RepID=A0ABP3XTE8_9FLAO
MYAIVEIAGQQFKVAKDQKVYVHRLGEEEGNSVKFDNVLLIGNGDDVTVGAPAIDGAQVAAKVVRHLKGDKVIVFKKKRRKGYKKKNGHRQYLTEIVIESIKASGAKKAAPKAKAEKSTGAKAEVKKTEAKPKAEAPKEENTKTAPKASTKKSTGKVDDLKKLEGAGPKAAEAMVNAGLNTFQKVANMKPEALKAILTAASSRMAHISTDTWPEQAQLAADGKWDELKELQDKLDGGKK